MIAKMAANGYPITTRNPCIPQMLYTIGKNIAIPPPHFIQLGIPLLFDEELVIGLCVFDEELVIGLCVFDEELVIGLVLVELLGGGL